MKTIIYLIITSLICVMLASSSQKTFESKKYVIIQATDIKVGSQLLTQSAKIISDRLKIYGLESFDVSILTEKGQIKVQLPDNIISSDIEELLTTKGEIAFYETLSRKEIAELLKNHNQLPGLLENDPEVNTADSKMGCVTSQNRDLINEYCRTNKIGDNCKISWGMKSDKSLFCLFGLKVNNAGNPLLSRTDIETIKSSKDNRSQSYMIEIKFKPTSSKIWTDATKNNLNKPIAIVIDDKVFYTPVVKVPMVNGLCEISGNLTSKDVQYFLALANNEKLPLSFSLK
jgi:SecD/SecF fusion protein